MNTKGVSHAIAGIEKELDNLKAHLGISMDTGEEEEERDDIPQATKQVGRGRKKKTVPTMDEDSD